VFVVLVVEVRGCCLLCWWLRGEVGVCSVGD
jgi:hypothetical protein